MSPFPSMLKALRELRPTNVHRFYALAGQHMPWELKDLPRRLDKQPSVGEVRAEMVPALGSNDSGISLATRRIPKAIDSLSAEEREVFDLIRIQGVTPRE